jgi:hypothetical protein
MGHVEIVLDIVDRRAVAVQLGRDEVVQRSEPPIPGKHMVADRGMGGAPQKAIERVPAPRRGE